MIDEPEDRHAVHAEVAPDFRVELADAPNNQFERVELRPDHPIVKLFLADPDLDVIDLQARQNDHRRRIYRRVKGAGVTTPTDLYDADVNYCTAAAIALDAVLAMQPSDAVPNWDLMHSVHTAVVAHHDRLNPSQPPPHMPEAEPLLDWIAMNRNDRPR